METDIQFGIVPKWLLEVASDRAVTMYAWLAATFDIGNEQYAGVDWLAARSGKSKSYVTRAMKELVEIGAVTRRRRMNKSTMTTIHRLPSSQIRRDGEVKFAESGEGKSDALSRPINYPDLVDPEKNTSTLIAEFNEFYKHYPLRRGRGDAVRAWPAARKKASLAEILTGLEAYIEDVRRQRAAGFPDLKYKLPGPWLRAERWADEYDDGAADDKRFAAYQAEGSRLTSDEIERRRESSEFPFDEDTQRFVAAYKAKRGKR